MLRERTLKVVVVLLGLFFCAGIYPIAQALWHPDAAEDYGDYMMLSLYVTLGVFLLIAGRNPSAHRSLIAFTAWSSFAHALVMGTMAFRRTEPYRTDKPGDDAARAWIGEPSGAGVRQGWSAE